MYALYVKVNGKFTLFTESDDFDTVLRAAYYFKREKKYINLATGSIDTYDGWYYTDENGDTKNAVDEGEVFEVEECVCIELE